MPDALTICGCKIYKVWSIQANEKSKNIGSNLLYKCIITVLSGSLEDLAVLHLVDHKVLESLHGDLVVICEFEALKSFVKVFLFIYAVRALFHQFLMLLFQFRSRPGAQFFSS